MSNWKRLPESLSGYQDNLFLFHETLSKRLLMPRQDSPLVFACPTKSSGHVPESNLGAGKFLHYSGQFACVCVAKVVGVENLGLEAEYGISHHLRGHRVR